MLHCALLKHNEIIPALKKNTFKDFALAKCSQMKDSCTSEKQLTGLLGNADRKNNYSHYTDGEHTDLHQLTKKTCSRPVNPNLLMPSSVP